MLTERTLGLLGVGLCLFVLGCGPGGGQNANENGHTGNGSGAEAHDHSEEGPHGGHLIVLGEEEYHAELVHDEATHTVTIHILDAAGKEDVAIDQTDIVLQVFQDGEFATHTLSAVGSEGKSSEFSLVNEELCDLLLHSEELKGRVNVTIDGKDYVGMIDHESHDHTGHAHAADGDEGHPHDEDDDEGHAHDEDGEEGHGHDEDGDEGHAHDEDGDEGHAHDEDGDEGHAHDEDGDEGHSHAEDGDEGHSHDEDGDAGHAHDEDGAADHGDHPK